MRKISLFLLLALLLLTNAAFAAVDLGVDEITLAPGEFYAFAPQDGLVYWLVSDESVIELDQESSIGVRALEPGTAVVFAMSEDYSETDSCVVTVTGEAKAVKSADLYYQALTDEDLAKVNDPAIAAVLRLSSDSAAFPMGVGDLSGFEYKVLIVVKDGSQQKIADAAEAMGLAGTWAYEYVPVAALRGDANDIAKLLIDYRDDIVSVETDEMYSIEADEETGVTHLQGEAETLSNIKAVHSLGYKGEDQYIAIIDTGVDPDHQEFLDDDGNSRVVYQHCYSSEPSEGTVSYDYALYYRKMWPVCGDGTTEAESAEPSGAVYKTNFDHGTHVAGIAAGRNGVAPQAKIIALQAFTEAVYYYRNSDGSASETIKDKTCYIMKSDELKALEFIRDLMEDGIVPAAVNMSYGGGAYSGYTAYLGDEYFSEFLQEGTIPCAASGNNSYTGYVCAPADSKYTFTVGWLVNSSTPAIHDHSNHSKLVNILAPGTYIYSSLYTNYNGTNYGYKSGTSMATPMVAGAFALLRQMYPQNTAQELENFMLKVTDKSAARSNISKPVMNFDNISKYAVETPIFNTDYTVSTGSRTITVKTLIAEHDVMYSGFKVALYNSEGKLLKSQVVTSGKTVTFSNLTNNTKYTVKVAGYTVLSGTKYYTADSETPAAQMAVPTGLKLDASENSVTVSWPNHESDRIEIQYSKSSSSDTAAVTAVGAKEITGLDPNTVYTFRFRWYDPACEYYSPWSAVFTTVTITKPAAADYEVSSGNRIISVKLKQNANYTGCKVEIISAAGKTVSSRTVGVTQDTTLTFSGLTNNTVYKVRVYSYRTISKVNYFSAYAETSMAPMPVPTGLSLITDDESNTVTASWPNYAGETVQLRYKEGVDGEYTIATSTADSETVTLEKNKVYYFSFRWYNDPCAMYSPWSAEDDVMIIAAPEAKTAKVGYRKIRVYFDDVDTLTGHQIKVYTVSPEKLVRTVNVKYTSNPEYADITGLTNGVQYRFEVYAYRTSGKKTDYSKSTEVFATPQLKPETDDIPENVTVSGGAKKITISWQKDPWTGGHYIELRRQDNLTLAASAYAANNATSYTFSGGNVEYDVPYIVRVWKYNERSPKAVGDEYVQTYAASLATPGSFAVSTGDESLKVTWTYTGSADNVEVYYSTVSNKGPFDGKAVCPVSNGTNTCMITGLKNDTLYYVKAAAVRTLAGESEEAADDVTIKSVETSVKSAVPLPVLSSATVTAESKTVKVQYTKDPDVHGYTIQLYKVVNGKASLVKAVTSDNAKVSTDDVTVTFTKLSNGTTYRVTISSYKKIGKTTYRGAVYTSTPDVIPSDSAAASKDVVLMTEMTEPFDGFVDPIGEMDSQSGEAVDVEIREEEEKQPSVFDLFRL